MDTFINYQPSDLDRLRWHKDGYHVFCNNCWWFGSDKNHDQCPDCNSDKLEWIMNREDDYDYMMVGLQSIKPIVSD
jgi:hypothetical protein